ncbi:alanyl-tRNA editing protein [Fictibacillus phosphorivorans]|uniref:alanyl-tRNA editing protein n=1 Tax=Fictibacillus phosphorivorans TaxID=1221500 RepID=UPI001293807E|nr:alanine--tRNA ligase-related protein [Fictibacillus phosphorivorans]MQR96278.1 alanyl-tRNA editing protein [Fictibacillus phosphorivorans]
MTEKLYYSSPYTKTWETNVKTTFEKEEEWFVILETTAFYPTGGGQPFDTGTISGSDVLDVFIENDEVIHKVKKLPETSSVICHLNWDRRFDHMQHHTGQHLLSAVCYSLYDARTVSFHLGSEVATIDIEIDKLSQQQLDSIEKAVNHEIYKNRLVHTYFVSDQELQQLPLLKMPKVTENIRIVQIEGIEHNACGGTHVQSTAEIGIIKLLKAEKQKGATRLHFKCGQRALEDYNEALKMINKISSMFNTGRDEVINRLEKWEHNQKELESENKRLKEENNHFLSKELIGKVETGLLLHAFDDKSFKDTKDLAIKIASEESLLILLASTVENRAIFMHDGSFQFSCGTFFKENLRSFNGKGGGNDRSAQAGFASQEDMNAFIKFVKDTF